MAAVGRPSTASTARSTATSPLSRDSGQLGGSYGSSTPVRPRNSPARARAYNPFGSRATQTASGDVDMHLDERQPATDMELTDRVTPVRERRDERHDRDRAGVREQPREFACSRHVLPAVGGTEPEIATDMP